MGEILLRFCRSVHARWVAYFEADRAAHEQNLDCPHVEIGACEQCKADWAFLSAS